MLGKFLSITPCEVVYSPLIFNIYGVAYSPLHLTNVKLSALCQFQDACSPLLVQYQWRSYILFQNITYYILAHGAFDMNQIQVHWIRSPPFYWTQFNKAVNVFFISFTDAFSDSKPVEEIYKSAWIAFRQIRPNLVLKQFNNIM